MKAPLLLFRTLCPKGLDRDFILLILFFFTWKHPSSGRRTWVNGCITFVSIYSRRCWFFKVIFFPSQIHSTKSTCSRVTKATTSAAIPAVVVKMCSFWRFLFHYILLIINTKGVLEKNDMFCFTTTCAIWQNSKPYAYLVKNLYPSIFF